MTEQHTPARHTPVTETQEFRDAVAAAKAEILASLGDLKKEAGGAVVPGDDLKFAQALALAISQLGDQGIGKQKAIDPAVLHARAESREKMTVALIKARAEGKSPLYGLTNKVYLDEVLVQPVWIDVGHKQRQTEVEWPGVPNEAMVPLNDVAKEIFGHFSDSIGTSVKLVPDQPLRVTAGGLVVHGAPSAARRDAIAVVGNSNASKPGEFGEGLRVKRDSIGGEYKETHVLGTVAAPARQTA